MDLARDLYLFAPELTLILLLVVLFIVDAVFPKSRSGKLPLVISLIGCGVGGYLTYLVSGTPAGRFFSDLVVHDGLTHFFRYFFFFTCAMCLILANVSREVDPKYRMEFTLLLVIVTFGMSLMVLSQNMLLLYLGIETVSIVSFVLAGFGRQNIRSNEASLKYLIFGALASGLMIYGFSLLYGITGGLHYHQIFQYLKSTPIEQNQPALLLSLILIYGGFAYKIASFPMHFWAPDVYEGSPTPVTAFFSVGPKAAGFGALIRFVTQALSVESGHGDWNSIVGDEIVFGLAVISAITMFVGNLSALAQTNVKRMLAYSSIAHVGYLLMGLVTMKSVGLSAVLFYLFVYCLMNLGAFWVVLIVTNLKGNEHIDSFKGLGWQMPWVGVAMAIFLFSLTGIPLFAGFVGKFLLFGALLSMEGYLWLAVLGVLNSVISLYYYARILKTMWFDTPDEELNIASLPVYHTAGLALLAIPTIVFGIFFSSLLHFVQTSIESFRGG